MLFMCNRPAYRGVPVTFVYVVLETPDHQELQHHSIRFGVDEQLRRLTKTRGPMTTEWLAASLITAGECVSSNTTLADVQRQQQQRPVVGNVTTHTFDVADTHEVRFSRIFYRCCLNGRARKQRSGHWTLVTAPLT